MNSSEILTAFRKKHGLTQVQLAQLLDVHPLTVSKWERSVNPLPAKYRGILDTAKVKRSRGLVTVTYTTTHNFLVSR